MELMYLVMESDIESSRVVGIYTSLPLATQRAALCHKRLDGWDNMTISIDVWPNDGGYKVTTYDHTGKVK